MITRSVFKQTILGEFPQFKSYCAVATYCAVYKFVNSAICPMSSADYKKSPSHVGEGALGASFPFWNWLEMLKELYTSKSWFTRISSISHFTDDNS